MRTQKKIEFLIYLFIWAIVFTIPIFSDNTLNGKDWQFIFSEWIRYIPLLLIFTLNNFWLSKRYFLKEKYGQYIIAILLLLVVFAFASEFTRMLNHTLFAPQNPLFQHPPNKPIPPEIREMRLPLKPIFESIILSILMIGFNDAIKLVFKFHQTDLKRKENQKLHLEAQLSFLRTQISPHFFMNTLNNIHALVDINPRKSQESIIKLSNLMRYLLKQSKDGQNTINEEFKFLNSYIDLMSLRYSEEVKISTHFFLLNPEIKIPSLLFVSVVENAFKYGVSYSKKSFINIDAIQDENSLKFIIENSKNENKTEQIRTNLKKTRTGIGLDNLKKQLNLLFPKNHLLKIDETKDKYKLTIKIPLIL